MTSRAMLGQVDTPVLDAARAEGAAELRARCRAIMMAPEAEERFEQATVLALDTSMAIADALAILEICATDAAAAQIPGLTIDTPDAAYSWLQHLRRPQ